MKNQNNKIIDLAAIRFGVGSRAWHTKYRVCYIAESIGMIRRVKYIQHGNGNIIWESASVHRNELMEMKNPCY